MPFHQAGAVVSLRQFTNNAFTHHHGMQSEERFGVGIDEDTALVVRDHIGEVVGAGGVTFVDGRETVRFDNAHELEKGRQLTLSHLRVGIVGTKYHLNLKERELDELLIGEPRRHLTELVTAG